MTILLSNDTNQSTRQIKIKPVHLLTNQTSTTDELARMQTDVNEEVHKAQAQLEHIKVESEELLRQAREQINKEKELWQHERQSYIEEAKKLGYEEGFSTGEKESRSKYQTDLEKANQIITAARRDYHSLIDENEEAILTLAIHTAEKIMKQMINQHPTSFLPIIKSAIKELKDQSIISIYLHPNQFEFVLQHKDELKSILENDAKLSFYVNEELDEYGCKIKHPFGQMDAGIDTQLQELRQVLYEIVGEKNQ
ncbi:flagellar assembly protein H [Virgibacillus salexigens]|uniref:Flagellar assembly protein FliH n=1 Tax=Virgibacillus massiliensis TaxID=1462526 RepID=A0A024QDU3_9BACI|nr:flagellar assembly protein H [Virgibacillus massiliensis]